MTWQAVICNAGMEKRIVSSDSAKVPEPFTIVIPASELPKRILDQFPAPPSADAHFAVTVEPAESEAEKLVALQRDLQAGLDDLAAGRVSEGNRFSPG